MKCIRVISFGLCLLFFLTISGAYATWHYAEIPLSPVGDDFKLEMGLYQWDGSEELPDDEETGQAHAQLIDRLINGEGIGLNSSDSYLNDQIDVRKGWNRDYLGSMAIKQGDQLKALFITGTENVTFLLEWSGNSTYYIYTTSMYLGTNGNLQYSIGTKIPEIYRTTVVLKDGRWTATETVKGSATSAYYKESQPDIFGLATKSKIPGFDPESWTADP